jgi:methylglyoxal synthase
MGARKRIALVAHDHRKQDLLDWAAYNRQVLEHHELFATGTTGGMLSEALGLRIAVVYNIPIACNRASADFMVSLPLFPEPYERSLIDYEHRIHPTELGLGVSA